MLAEKRALNIGVVWCIIKESMKQKGFAPIIILVLIALAVVGYFGYKNYWPKSQTPVITSPLPTVTADPTVNWKAYTNNKYQFEFKYPSDWIDLASKPEDVTFFKSGDNQIHFVVKKSMSINQLIQELSVTNQEYIMFNDVKFTKISYYTKPAGDIIEYVVAKNNDLLIFSGNVKILSTFKFTQ